MLEPVLELEPYVVTLQHWPDVYALNEVKLRWSDVKVFTQPVDQGATPSDPIYAIPRESSQA
jgi:hypothetical protein